MKGQISTLVWSTHQDRGPHFTGRNGYMMQGGIEVHPYGHKDSLMLAPLTSKGKVGRCDMEIPLDRLPEFIALLQGVVDANKVKG
jgi:hypothetical protein